MTMTIRVGRNGAVNHAHAVLENWQPTAPQPYIDPVSDVHEDSFQENVDGKLKGTTSIGGDLHSPLVCLIMSDRVFRHMRFAVSRRTSSRLRLLAVQNRIILI